MSAPDERQHPPGNGKEGALLSPSVRSIQQPLQQQHEDFDWMGVLDSLDDHFDLVEHDRLVYQQYHQYHYQPPHTNGNGNVAPGSEDAASSPANLGGGTVQDQNPLVVVGDRHRNQHENHSHDRWDPSSSPSTTAGVRSGEGSNCDGVAALMVASAIAAAAAAADACGGSKVEVESISMSGGGATALAVADTAEMDDKKQSRVERKRTREKKRRFDTNSQFTALAELVKEIEATDLAEEALFDFNKRYDNHDGQEEDDEQQQRQQHDIGDGSIKTNCSDRTDNQHRCKRLDGNDISFAPEERQSKMIKSTDVQDNSNNNNMTSSSLLPPTTGTTKSPTLLSSTSSMSSSTATSNRIDLIARTIVQLNQFRMLRRRRNSELRDCQRKNCELRKECEGLHRLVAQYKAMGKMGGEGGYTRPQVQEKVMMMVPMMVPQDAVSQIAAGYPAAHQHQVASASFAPATTMISHHPFFTNMATPHPWMGSGGGGTMMSSSASYQPHHSTTSVGGPGMQFVQQQQQQQHLQHPSLPPSSQLYQHNSQAASAVGLTNLQPSGGLHSMTSGIASEATHSSNPHPHGILDNGTGGSELTVVQGVTHAGQTQSPHASATAQIGLQQHPLPDAGGTVANHTFNTSSQSSHVTPAGVPFGMHPQHFHHAIIANTPHNNAMMPSHTATPYNPSQGHDTLSTMIMNHPNQHSLPNHTAEVGAPNSNNLSYSSFAVNDSSATPAHHQQQLVQQQPSTQHHRDEAEKPLVQDTTTHHGGGGNLAHCA